MQRISLEALGYSQGMDPSKPSKQPRRLMPTGECWCGCEKEVPVGSFFAPGHDKVAESAVILTIWGGVPEFLVAHGFGPDGKNARHALEMWKADGNLPR